MGRKNSSIQILVNYKRLNAISAMDKTSLTSIDGLIDSLDSDEVYPTFDLMSALFQAVSELDNIHLQLELPLEPL